MFHIYVLRSEKRIILRRWGCLALQLSMLGTALGAFPAKEARNLPQLSGGEIIEKMVAMNQKRAAALRTYTSTRIYRLDYNGLGTTKKAEMVVKMTYRQPDHKEFTIVSEAGSKLLRARVLKRLVESEVEAMGRENRQSTAITPENYEFHFAGSEGTPQHNLYVFDVLPMSKNKFLFRGRIWIDSGDFAVSGIEGEPAQNPSWWIKKVAFRHSYKKIGDFWLPARNETVTKVRIFGRSLLAIDYKDYQINQATGMTPAGNVGTIENPAARHGPG